jgi:hypothetical protein
MRVACNRQLGAYPACLRAAHSDMSGLTTNAPEPWLYGRKVRKLKTSLVRDMRVAIERDIGDGVLLADEEAAVSQMLFHDLERGVPGPHLFLQLGLAVCWAPQVANDVACSRDIWLMAVLLLKDPLIQFWNLALLSIDY